MVRKSALHAWAFYLQEKYSRSREIIPRVQGAKCPCKLTKKVRGGKGQGGWEISMGRFEPLVLWMWTPQDGVLKVTCHTVEEDAARMLRLYTAYDPSPHYYRVQPNHYKFSLQIFW